MLEADFRFIYGMEYFHRMFGRAIGIVFVAPALYFAARGWLRGPLAGRVALLFAAGGAQGLVGWWMVRSGLQARGPPKAEPLVCAEQTKIVRPGVWAPGRLVDDAQRAAGA